MSEPNVLSTRPRPSRLAVPALVLALLAVLALTASAAAKPLSKADRAFVDATVEAAMAEEGQPGVSISISGPRGDYTRTYGVRDIDSGAPLRRPDHFRIASITKTFTATAILRQVDKGRLRLTDKLDQFVKGIPNGELITVRHLLAMQSGIYEYGADPAFQQGLNEDLMMPFGPADVVRILRDSEPYFAPGEQMLYTNSNYVLLGLILERVTGESAQAAITKEVIRPLKLSHTSFPSDARMPMPFTKGYGRDASGALVDRTAFNPNVFWTAGAMNSTVGDLAKYAKQLGTGALLSPAMQRERLELAYAPYGLEGPDVFGYGLGILSFGTWIGHNGSVPGYGSEVFYEPRSGAVIAGAENMGSATIPVFSRIFHRIGAHLYPGSMD